MANATLLAEVLQTLTPGSWESECALRLNSSGYDWSYGLVGASGTPIAAFNASTWGIDNNLCLQFCSSSELPFAGSFDFQRFSAAFTNYFLPWIALTAQLVYETGDMWNNVMSFCLALGSPAFVTYSLTITILNRYWVRGEFSDLAAMARAEFTHTGDTEYTGRIRAARFVLQEGQQVPLRFSQEDGWLTSLLALPQNSTWWRLLEDRLKTARRGFTASLVAQMFVAVIAFLFTVISSFAADLGDIATGNQIGSGSLWIWLIPVILGWVTVGTQYRHNSVERALMAFPADRMLGTSLDPKDFWAEPKTLNESQQGLKVESSLNFESPQRRSLTDEDHRQLTRYGAKVEGDGLLKGPIFNYARVFVWWQLSSTIHEVMFKTVDAMRKAKVSEKPEHIGTKHEVDGCTEVSSILKPGSSSEVFPPWSHMPASVYRRIVAASFAAIFLQWGTTGASILIGYYTSTIGLGCRTGSYFLYGIMGTITWALLMISSFFSHEAMLRSQASRSLVVRTKTHSIVCSAAVITRYLGKFLAMVNTIWLILSSLFEIVGAYNNCWCKGCVLNYGDDAWVTLFKTAHDLDVGARLPWGGGLAMMLIVIISFTLFAVGSSLGSDDD